MIGPRTAELIGREGLLEVAPVTLKGIEHAVRPFEVPWE